MKREHNHYFKPCPFEEIDVYRVLKLFDVTDPCLQHAIKKLLVAGGRGAKDSSKDVHEAVVSCQRFLEMRGEEKEVVSRTFVRPPQERSTTPVVTTVRDALTLLWLYGQVPVICFPPAVSARLLEDNFITPVPDRTHLWVLTTLGRSAAETAAKETPR